MEYTTPNELANQYGKSLKTIYNRITKYKDKIRTKKEFWKTIVNCKDFEQLHSQFNKNYKKKSKSIQNKNENNNEKAEEGDFVKLENNYKYSLQRIENLEKHNSNLSTQLNEYATLFTEEKKEKQQLQVKLEEITQRLTTRIESFANEKIVMERKFYMVLSFFAFSILIIVRMNLPEILELFAKSEVQPSNIENLNFTSEINALKTSTSP